MLSECVFTDDLRITHMQENLTAWAGVLDRSRDRFNMNLNLKQNDSDDACGKTSTTRYQNKQNKS